MSDTNDESSSNRRQILTGIVGLGLVSSFGAGRVTAESSPDGNVGTATNPYLTAYLDRVDFVGRTTDPSDAEDGTIFYREDL